MEQVYALGVIVIEFVQYTFKDWHSYLEWVNHVSSPSTLLRYGFPLLSIVDSVFAAQLLLVLGFGGWLNVIMKWWLLEDRPYWWVRETTFYTGERPRLKQTRQTCETGPGSPSGHSAAGAAALVLLLMFVSQVMRDCKIYLRYWKYVMYPLCGWLMVSVILARMFVAAHFPHQCLLGTLIGAFMAPALCLYVSDPFIWGLDRAADTSYAVTWHVVSVAAAAGISAVTYWGMKLCGMDPQWSVKLASRWCERKRKIKVSTTTPLFTLMKSIARLLGWALCVTPSVCEYRHYTQHRSLLIAAFSTFAITHGLEYITSYLHRYRKNKFKYYAYHFILNTAKPALFLRLTPALAMWPFPRKQ